MHQNGIENAAHNKQLCIPTVLDMAGRNIDLTVTCASAMDELEECKREIGVIMDQLDGLKVKQRLQSQNEEVSALLKNKMRSTRR